MSERLICALIAVVVSVVVNKILAVHTFRVIDGHIEDTFEMTEKFVEDAKKLIGDANLNK